MKRKLKHACPANVNLPSTFSNFELDTMDLAILSILMGFGLVVMAAVDLPLIVTGTGAIVIMLYFKKIKDKHPIYWLPAMLWYHGLVKLKGLLPSPLKKNVLYRVE